jgi:chromosome segregation ATPase
MTTAMLLAKAVLMAQERIAALTTHRREQLKAHINELRRAEHLSADANVLEQQRSSLTLELEALRTETEHLEAQHTELAGSLQRKLAETGQRLAHIYKLQGEEMRLRLTTQDFMAAMAEYAGELERGGLDLQNATPAQLREQLPLLQDIASHFDALARTKAGQVSQQLIESPRLDQTLLELEERKRQYEHDLQLVAGRLGSHSRTGKQIPLFEDILAAEEGMLLRLRQEVLESLLRDARIEREKGLGGSEPLRQLSDIQRDA